MFEFVLPNVKQGQLINTQFHENNKSHTTVYNNNNFLLYAAGVVTISKNEFVGFKKN